MFCEDCVKNMKSVDQLKTLQLLNELLKFESKSFVCRKLWEE